MMGANFRTIRRFLGPRWLTSEGESGLIGYSLDIIKDAFVERLRLGLLARQPQHDPSGATTAEADALAAMGRDRLVIRGITETNAEYAARLVRYLDDRKQCGSPFALLQKLSEYTGAGAAFRTVDNSGNWYSRSVDGTETILIGENNWDWDGAPALWSRFWVVIYPNGIWTIDPEVYGGAREFGDREGTIGLSMTRDEVAAVRAIVDDWKPGGTRCPFIIIAPSGATFDPTAPEPDGTWGNWSRYDAGVRVRTRLAGARYISGSGG